MYSNLMLFFKGLACSCIFLKWVFKDQRVIHPNVSRHIHLHPLYPTISQRPRFHCLIALRDVRLTSLLLWM